MDYDAEQDGGLAVAEPPAEGCGDSCPRCNHATTWGSASWCPNCGYYPLADDYALPEPVEELPTDFAEDGTEEESQVPALQRILKLSFAGIVALIAINISILYYFYYHEGDLGLVSVCEIVFGLSLIAAAQFWTAAVAMLEGRGHTLLDSFLNPVEIWIVTTRRLKNAVWRLNLPIWGLGCIIFSFAILGGFDPNRFFSDIPKEKPPSLLKVVAENAPRVETKDDVSMEEAMDEFTDAAGVDDLDGPPKPAAPPSVSFVVYGYMTDGGTDITRILLAESAGGELKHKAVLRMKSLPEQTQLQLNEQLPKLRQEATNVSTRFRARWVNPIMKFEDGSQSAGPAAPAATPDPEFRSPALDYLPEGELQFPTLP